jgi:hypothetical protein
MGLFVDTTQVALKEMMEEFGSASRFGRVFSEEDLQGAALRMAEFFEMTLNLRSQFGQPPVPSASAAQNAVNSSPTVLSQNRPGAKSEKTRAEATKQRPVLEDQVQEAQDWSAAPARVSTSFFQLPRKKVPLAPGERERINMRSGK